MKERPSFGIINVSTAENRRQNGEIMVDPVIFFAEE